MAVRPTARNPASLVNSLDILYIPLQTFSTPTAKANLVVQAQMLLMFLFRYIIVDYDNNQSKSFADRCLISRSSGTAAFIHNSTTVYTV